MKKGIILYKPPWKRVVQGDLYVNSIELGIPSLYVEVRNQELRKKEINIRLSKSKEMISGYPNGHF